MSILLPSGLIINSTNSNRLGAFIKFDFIKEGNKDMSIEIINNKLHFNLFKYLGYNYMSMKFEHKINFEEVLKNEEYYFFKIFNLNLFFEEDKGININKNNKKNNFYTKNINFLEREVNMPLNINNANFVFADNYYINYIFSEPFYFFLLKHLTLLTLNLILIIYIIRIFKKIMNKKEKEKNSIMLENYYNNNWLCYNSNLLNNIYSLKEEYKFDHDKVIIASLLFIKFNYYDCNNKVDIIKELDTIINTTKKNNMKKMFLICKKIKKDIKSFGKEEKKYNKENFIIKLFYNLEKSEVGKIIYINNCIADLEKTEKNKKIILEIVSDLVKFNKIK